MASEEQTAKDINQLQIPDTYEDPTPRKVLTKKNLHNMVWRSLLLQSSFNYERMQGGGWTYSLIPGLKKIHTNKKDLSYSLLDNLQFYNTHPFLVTFIQGVILAMEENKENRSTIRGVKVALMGPLGGIGDALFWLTLLPITAGIGVSLSMQGNVFGPILFLILFNAVHFSLLFWLMNYGYNTGTRAIAAMRENTKKISRAASIVGLMVVGALVATYITFKLDGSLAQINAGGVKVALQAGVIDKIMPKLLPLLYTLFCFWMLKKGRSPLTLIIITVVIGLVGAGTHLFAF
ncbi:MULTISPECIES: PTS system mannose/fructose/sorbose family transporter subunit IID [unclassified Sporolactobacillus]|uniref:PTS system mannose/fructose/sorbose family transporter subunit IID n=1 Tax=unclassified Sporolactobacillus TaxID=2628533 RepID=UPI002368EC0F|nr:PTS system mannose/fructose/sorbose family transporter subunit IID [Sporolactobacillus sp. CQH2019]MDD9149961.1 PTS system mannose/fructose/sorbose family transporter subunit IID [Sporolactobacillus sp. CQH2019]